ncbi:MAG: putative sulfate/molybdate transporter, partial [Candidatus Zixiibacteriota bacterium]
RGVSLKQMSLSIGIMNLIAPILGGMPMCHGSGGLAGHYRFGARTGGSVIMLGVFKIVAALVFGAGLIKLLQVFPESILGVLLVLAGVELALPARDMTEKREFRITVITALAIVALNTGVGFLVGAIYAALTRTGFRGGNQSEAG